MEIRKILRAIYHLFVKHDMIGPIGRNCYGHIGKNSTLYKPKITDNNKKSIYIGDDTTILNGARFQIYSDITGINSKITIGNNCYLGYNLSLLAGADIIIEDGVLMASNILISSENHSINPELSSYYMDQELVCNPVIIKEGCWIGEKVCVLPGVTIGRKSIIGASSVVTKDIPDYCVAVGSPAKVVKKYNFEKHKWESS